MSPAAILTPAPSPANGAPQPLKSSTKAIITPSSRLSSSNSTKIPAWVKPDLTRLLRVEHNPGAFASRSISLVSLPPGATFARITTPTPAVCAYSSVQASRTLHIELNCDLVYINHSCAPTLIFDMERWEVRVNPGLEQGLREGDELTFFYPSTEWKMDQAFDCLCGATECKGWIAGARDLDRSILSGYWLSAHVREMLEERGKEGAKNGGS